MSENSYVLTEIAIGTRGAGSKHRKILPVMISPTSTEQLPAELRDITILHPRGDIVAEINFMIDLLKTQTFGKLQMTICIIVALLSLSFLLNTI